MRKPNTQPTGSSMKQESCRYHTVEKIGGTSMSNYPAVRDNIICRDRQRPDGSIFVVSAYGGITNRLLEHKKSGHPGVYALFTSAEDERAWHNALHNLREHMHEVNASLFDEAALLREANNFIDTRLADAERVLDNLQALCQHGHFELEDHLLTVREMLASIGEAHSAWNTARLLQTPDLSTSAAGTRWRRSRSIPSSGRPSPTSTCPASCPSSPVMRTAARD